MVSRGEQILDSLRQAEELPTCNAVFVKTNGGTFEWEM